MSNSPPEWVFSRMHRTADLNARQHAIIDAWEAWLAEGEGDLEVEGFTVPKLLDALWMLAIQYKNPQATDLVSEIAKQEATKRKPKDTDRLLEALGKIQTMKRNNGI